MKHFISLDKAKKMIGHFRHKKEHLLKDEFKGKHLLPTCLTYERAAFDALLKQPGCAHVRLYFGMDENAQVKIIAVGVNEKGEDMVTASTFSTTGETGEIVDEGVRCPTECPPTSPLTTEDVPQTSQEEPTL